MEEDIKILENKDCMWIYPENRVMQAIENLIKEYKRVKENRDWYFENSVNKLASPEMLHKILRQEYIPKSKIKEKIEELDKQRIKMEQDDVGVGFTLGNEWSDLKAKIQVLQELMEDK